jgi:SAM-dependent methyltransferase
MSQVRRQAYGQAGASAVDRLGGWLSKRAVLQALPRRPGLEVLDLGCGHHARLLRDLRPMLSRGTGIDLTISSEAREQKSLDFLESPLERALPSLPDHSYDVELMISVLEHLVEPLEALAHCYRVLKGAGVLLVNVPTWRGKGLLELSAFRLGASPAQEMDDHKMYYDERDLWPLLVRAGFLPRDLRLRTHKLGLNLFAIATREP